MPQKIIIIILTCSKRVTTITAALLTVTSVSREDIARWLTPSPATPDRLNLRFLNIIIFQIWGELLILC